MASSNGTIDFFYDFCGGELFWDPRDLNKEVPDFSSCFLDTVLIWAPCAYLWLYSPFFITFLYKCKRYTPLPFSVLNLAKSILSAVLAIIVLIQLLFEPEDETKKSITCAHDCAYRYRAAEVGIHKGISSAVLAIIVLVQLLFQEQDGYGCDSNQSISAASYTALGLKCATFAYSIVLTQIQRHRGVKTSGVPFVFWLLMVACEALPLYTHVGHSTSCKEDVVFYIYFALLCLQLILHCVVEKHSRTGYYDFEFQNVCPEENASILSRVWFHWLTPVVWNCYRKKFTVEEFWDPSPKLEANSLGPLLEEAWLAEVKRCEIEKRRLYNQRPIPSYQNGVPGRTRHRSDRNMMNGNITKSEDTPLLQSDHLAYEPVSDGHPSYMRDYEDVGHLKPNLYRTVLKTFWIYWAEATSFMGVAEVSWLLQPVMLRFIIQMIENKGTELGTEPIWQGYMYSILLFIVLSLNSMLFHISFHHMMTLGLKAKTALICLIYKKALTMKRSGTKTTTVGEIVNLMSVDCQRIQDAFLFSFYIILIFVIIIIATVQLWDLMGIASLGEVAVLAIVLPVVGLIAIKLFKLQNDLLYLKGNRIKILNEIVGGIKVLKMYAWEPSFMKKVQTIRNMEISKLWSYAILTATNIVFAIHSPFIICFVLFLIYVLTSPTHTLDAEQAFTTLSIVNILRYPIALCPFLVNGAVQAYVSIGRIQEFLWTEDLNTDNVNFVKDAENPVTVSNGEFSWTKDVIRPTLRGINMKVRDGQIIAVVGHVGSGKSSLMAACLGELERLKGSVTIKGSIAYVPQEAWIQNMTLRDNILFGKPYHEKKYRKVLEACALLPDLQILAGGDMTEIGEKGINISGGQKQRVSLARAVYNNADIYFLDDPLSAVDSHVGKHLFKQVIGNEGLLRHKTRILVTHGVHWLPMVDSIVVLKGGTISESGSYEELLSYNGDFAEFLQQYLQQDEQSSDEDHEIQEMKDKMLSQVEEVKSDGGATTDEEPLTQSGRKRAGQSTSHSRRRTVSTRRQSSVFTLSRSISEAQRHTSEAHVHGAVVDDFSRLTADESSEEGAIKMAVLLKYMNAMGYISVVIVFVSVSLFQGLNIFSNFWLTYWTEDQTLKNVSLSGTPEYEEKYIYYLLMYLLYGVLQGVFVFLGFYLALTRMVRASGKLHNYMLTSILRSPMAFFDTTPIGRIMNRFSSDIDIMDNKLPESFRLWTIMIFSVMAVVLVVSITTPIFIAAIVPIGIFFIAFVRFYLPTARTMRRTESVCRSPIYNHFSETITGAAVIRAYNCAERFVMESRKRVDKNIKFFYAANTGARWIGVRLEMLGNLIVLLATIFALISEDLSGAQVGLSISYAVQITITLNLVVLAVSEMEMNVISAERVTEYTNLPAEASWKNETTKPDAVWPTSGTLQFENYTTRYRPGLELVLKGINCIIKDGEKVGIVGRTGAGKSSLTLCLFRLIEAAGGCIKIDGVNISNLGLHDLRTKLTILPQDPVIFSGSLRSNLDPFDRHQDDGIWKALTQAHLKEFVLSLEGQLDYECGEGGQNLSVGQRQLVCLARTLLHKTRVLILDEATAAVDMETDDLIQDTIRTQFKECTIITVAHRLNTIMDYDRVMVLDAGLIKEFDSPQTLLADTNGIFFAMAHDAGLV